MGAHNRGLKVGAIALGAALSIGTVFGSVRATQDPLAAAPRGPAELIDRFLAPEQQPLVSYRAFRRLVGSTRGGHMEGSIEAWTSLDPKLGFSYQITSEEGSGTIRHKVLVAALQAEQKAFGKEAAKMALTRDNYEFLRVTDSPDNLMKVDIKPRRKHSMLIAGSVFLAGDTADLVRLEGEPTERPSFWTRHVKIVREYARVAGVRVPVAMRSTADVLIVGASNFAMTYQYTHINGEPIEP